MAYDPSSSRVVLFGGWDGVDFNDTWAYDVATGVWTELDPAGPVPPARHDHVMVYDDAAGKILLFGGIEKSTYAELDDTWAYDPTANTWTNLEPTGALPKSRCLHAMAYDPAAQKVILFGGSRRGGCLEDMWAYDSTKNAWTKVDLTGDKPLARYGSRMVYDAGLGAMVLFGGSDGHLLGDTWIYESAKNTWTNVIPVDSSAVKPPAREFYAMDYDPVGARVVLFGGCGVAPFGDTWAYESAANIWIDCSPAGDTPSARTFSSMVYAAGAGTSVLFGGSETVAASSPIGDTWRYDATP